MFNAATGDDMSTALDAGPGTVTVGAYAIPPPATYSNAPIS
ncbi:hypothetical protein CCP3SC1AL1_1820001 [Gammaproteobacteria bacterium]